MRKDIARAMAERYLTQSLSVVARRLSELSDEQREMVVAQMWSLYHAKCAQVRV
ncbi:MAG: hypothetical protein NC489_27370 [Ruminococcus flavefaciens]|nr:hypothetical protein [Ruminococcus flavefaciens]